MAGVRGWEQMPRLRRPSALAVGGWRGPRFGRTTFRAGYGGMTLTGAASQVLQIGKYDL